MADLAQEFGSILFFVFGGCCTNAFSLEALLKDNPALGSALTFFQLVFIALQALPSFLTYDNKSRLPRLKPRHVPLSTWAVQVILLTAQSLLNNWAFRFHLPLALQILIRSAGLVVAMCIGYFFFNKRYTGLQILGVIFVSVGVVTATVSRPTTSAKIVSAGDASVNTYQYFVGVAMLSIACILAGILGALQEQTFAVYGPHWREGIFYTHAMSVPVFAFLLPEVKRGLAVSFSSSSSKRLDVRQTALVLAVNLFTQGICVNGVNKLTTRVSSVTANLVLTARKAVSLCVSVWYFGNGWNLGMQIGAALVFLGSLIYGLGGGSKPSPSEQEAKDK